jgi:hypothetical protein
MPRARAAARSRGRRRPSTSASSAPANGGRETAFDTSTADVSSVTRRVGPTAGGTFGRSSTTPAPSAWVVVITTATTSPLRVARSNASERKSFCSWGDDGSSTGMRTPLSVSRLSAPTWVEVMEGSSPTTTTPAAPCAARELFAMASPSRAT